MLEDPISDYTFGVSVSIREPLDRGASCASGPKVRVRVADDDRLLGHPNGMLSWLAAVAPGAGMAEILEADDGLARAHAPVPFGKQRAVHVLCCAERPDFRPRLLSGR